jgi:K+-transporting ATPase ATPase A chain
MTALAATGYAVIARFESVTPAALARLGLSAAGNLEGKELRFGVLDSALFAEVTTAASCGAVNAMHDSFTPLGGLVPMLNMQLGEVVFGGVGAGMYGALVYVVLAVFLAGLMVGRTPSYLGKKIDSRDVRLASIFVLLPAFCILGFTALGVSLEAGRAGILNTAAGGAAHPHGLSEVLYAYSSATGNNGSAFAGLTAFSAQHPVFYSLTLGLAMFFGRFPLILAALALAGSLAAKKQSPPGPGSLPVEGALFAALLAAVIVVVGALTFLPALSLGPVVEHLQVR